MDADADQNKEVTEEVTKPSLEELLDEAASEVVEQHQQLELPEMEEQMEVDVSTSDKQEEEDTFDETVNEIAEAQSETPQAQSESPQDQSETPQDQSETLQDQSETLQDQSETPQDQSETPQDQSETPQDQSETPQDQSETPQDQSETPQDQSKTPQDQSEAPEVQSEAPEAQSEAPHAQIETAVIAANDVTSDDEAIQGKDAAEQFREDKPVQQASPSKQDGTNIIREAAKNVIDSTKNPKSGSFSLGIPGLTFSAQNLKIASDGTKMVQIHQSQITPSQLKALQSNPNIKVVFRHIQTGKSFTKAPKNLFNPQSSGIKRKISTPDLDDSVYNFDEDIDDDICSDQPRAKVPNLGNGNAKYARYNPNVGFKKRGPGRPRLNPEQKLGIAKTSKPALPAQIQLTDALVKLNKPGATHTVKVHVKQVTHDILINMELNPDYNIVLTVKRDMPPDHSLEELVKEWEEKETIEENKVEETKACEDNNEGEVKTTEEFSEIQQMETALLQNEAKVRKPKDAEEKVLARQQHKLKEERKEKEEAELLSAALLEKTSRSGRIRKPSRYSLDIARMTKRRSVVGDGDTSPDEDVIASPPPPKRPPPPPKPAQTTQNGDAPVKKRGRGRPRKIRKEEVTETVENVSIHESSVGDESKKSDSQTSSPPMSTEPRVMMSPADKRLAEDMRLQSTDESEKTDDDKPKDTEDRNTEQKPTDDKIEEKLIEENTKEDTSDVKKEESEQETDEVSITDKDKEVKQTKLDGEDKKEETESTSTDTKTDDKSEDKVQMHDEDQDKKIEESGPAPQELETIEDVTNIAVTDTETPSDVLARKLDMKSDDNKTPVAEAKEADKPQSGSEETTLKDFVEEEGDVDNKYRLRKLLQQCSIEEIRSVAIPKALEILTVGDFFLHKAGQMCSKKVSYSALYQQLEELHKALEKETVRYSTLLKRANKVGGERRMEKVILMPVYNKQAAESLRINSSSIDAHIGGIHQKPTTHMIAANSFRMNCKMDTPFHRLNLPELSDRSQNRKKRGGGAVNIERVYHQETDKADFIQRAMSAANNKTRGSWKRGYQVRKPSYLVGESEHDANYRTLQEHARIQVASRYQSQPVATREAVGVTPAVVESPAVNPIQVASQAAGLVSSGNEVQTSSTTIDTSMDLSAALNTDLTTQAAEVQTHVVPTAEDGTPMVAAEDGKQLVSIGDGQYVELPEGYTLIQTDEGYIIGQPGATFVQGEDGNVYMTSSEETTAATTELTDQVLTTTAPIVENQQSTEQLLEQLTET
ncbi:uncharacterized protein LOC143446593 [Clavelina lepadiformis]|uniref:uncharacterized protein LOC143446593 n=1 Tax=Clavelina lepadiformis TaxID=159417 RepID=UPI004042E924